MQFSSSVFIDKLNISFKATDVKGKYPRLSVSRPSPLPLKFSGLHGGSA